MQFAKDLVPHIDDLPTRQRASFPEIQDELFWKLYAGASPYSMLHVTGFYNVYQSVRYVSANGIPGAMVECGCFLGGVLIFMANLGQEIGLDRQIYAFDSFAGFPKGSKDEFLGQTHEGHVIDDFKAAVERNIRDAAPDGSIALIQGYVENTVPKTTIDTIALLRLDTDFYESTQVEFEHFYPVLSPGGVLIIDDYGYYKGARQATDEYLATLGRRPLLNRIDAGIWAGVKPS